MKRRIAIASGVLLALYVALCIVARVAYPRMLFPAPRLDSVPPELQGSLTGNPRESLVDFPQTTGGPTRALWVEKRTVDDPHSRVIVLFHGNGESIFDEYHLADELAGLGFDVLLVEYRGYGLTYGPPPTEDAMYEDGEAAIRWLAAKGFTRDRIVLWGFSLGTGVAAELAKRGRAQTLVLIAPYTSITAMARRWAPILPVGLILSHRFDTLSKAPAIDADTLVVHGSSDEVVPYAMGEAVAAALPRGLFLEADHAGHMDALADPDVFRWVRDWVDDPKRMNPRGERFAPFIPNMRHR